MHLLLNLPTLQQYSQGQLLDRKLFHRNFPPEHIRLRQVPCKIPERSLPVPVPCSCPRCSRQTSMPSLPVSISFSSVLVSCPPKVMFQWMSHSKVTTVTPLPPNCMCSSFADATPGTVLRSFWISSRRTPVPLPCMIRTRPMPSMMASSIYLLT